MAALGNNIQAAERAACNSTKLNQLLAMCLHSARQWQFTLLGLWYTQIGLY